MVSVILQGILLRSTMFQNVMTKALATKNLFMLFSVSCFCFQIAEMKHCDKCIYFESRKGKDLYLWISNIEKGPSVKFHVLNGKKIRFWPSYH